MGGSVEMDTPNATCSSLRRGGMFESTDEWNDPKLGLWKPDNRWG